MTGFYRTFKYSIYMGLRSFAWSMILCAVYFLQSEMIITSEHTFAAALANGYKYVVLTSLMFIILYGMVNAVTLMQLQIANGCTRRSAAIGLGLSGVVTAICSMLVVIVNIIASNGAYAGLKIIISAIILIISVGISLIGAVFVIKFGKYAYLLLGFAICMCAYFVFTFTKDSVSLEWIINARFGLLFASAVIMVLCNLVFIFATRKVEVKL